ncbi:LrgB family protein [Sporosarcina sp. G11-34]|uniref:LrgB family protein n=1 Tax=Sporosarcina sp. G11-34 TaxID=2849605 RepID=UPI0022A9B48D|nr:LrgB family protein [Sporosarcina sp. G11-34]MCZ2258346.1 LrgB family protein [Sporosarcina sp. G11-34]
MQIVFMSLAIIIVTVVIYFVMNFFYFKFHFPFLLPIVTSTFSIIVLLVMFKIPYATYMVGGKWIDFLLGPAVVALAIPLYKQRELLKQNMFPIIAGVFIGSLVGMVSGMFFAKIFGFSKEIILTILPKSITTPVALQIASGLGGVPSLAVVFVMLAGFTGAIFGPHLMKWGKIETTIGRGIALGTGSHAIGTSKALELGEGEGSVSSIAMTLSAIIGSIIGPFIAWLFYL